MHPSLSESSATVDNHSNQSHGTAAPKTRYLFFGEPARDTWLSTIVICLMLATLLALFWLPLKRTFANVEVNYNEGWNAYQQARVASGIPLYGARPEGFATSVGYPPISFHLIAWLGTKSTFNVTGRWVSLISLIATGVFVAFIVRRETSSRLIAVFSFLLYEIGIVLLRPDRIGMNDPQLLGEALSAAGLYSYIRNPDSKRLLCVSALLFCLAGFTKQNLIAFPAAVAIDLLFRSRKSFATWAGAMLLSGGLLTAMTFLIDGRYFLLHLMAMGGRSYSVRAAWLMFYEYATKFQALLVIGTAWSIREFRSRPLFSSAFVLSHSVAFLLAGGYGVDENIFFDALAASVILCGLALSGMRALAGLRSGALNSTATIMLGLFFMSIVVFVPRQLRGDRRDLALLAAREKEFQSAAEFLKVHPGPAVCQSLLLCYEAGKPFEFEPFSVRNLITIGPLREDDVLQLLRTHHFQAVQVNLHADEQALSNWADLRASLTSDEKDSAKERIFTPSFMKELAQDYQLSMRTSKMVIFCPK